MSDPCAPRRNSNSIDEEEQHSTSTGTTMHFLNYARCCSRNTTVDDDDVIDDGELIMRPDSPFDEHKGYGERPSDSPFDELPTRSVTPEKSVGTKKEGDDADDDSSSESSEEDAMDFSAEFSGAIGLKELDEAGAGQVSKSRGGAPKQSNAGPYHKMQDVKDARAADVVAKGTSPKKSYASPSTLSRLNSSYRKKDDSRLTPSYRNEEEEDTTFDNLPANNESSGAVTVSAFKEHQKTKVGLVFTRFKPSSKSTAMIAQVTPDSIFFNSTSASSSSLEGAIVKRVNGVSVRDPRHAAELVAGAVGEVKLTVVKQKQQQHQEVKIHLLKLERKMLQQQLARKKRHAQQSEKESGGRSMSGLAKKLEEVEDDDVSRDPGIVVYDSVESGDDDSAGDGSAKEVTHEKEDKEESEEEASGMNDSAADWSEANIIENAFPKPSRPTKNVSNKKKMANAVASKNEKSNKERSGLVDSTLMKQFEPVNFSAPVNDNDRKKTGSTDLQKKNELAKTIKVSNMKNGSTKIDEPTMMGDDDPVIWSSEHVQPNNGSVDALADLGGDTSLEEEEEEHTLALPKEEKKSKKKKFQMRSKSGVPKGKHQANKPLLAAAAATTSDAATLALVNDTINAGNVVEEAPRTPTKSGKPKKKTKGLTGFKSRHLAFGLKKNNANTTPGAPSPTSTVDNIHFSCQSAQISTQDIMNDLNSQNSNEFDKEEEEEEAMKEESDVVSVVINEVPPDEKRSVAAIPPEEQKSAFDDIVNATERASSFMVQSIVNNLSYGYEESVTKVKDDGRAMYVSNHTIEEEESDDEENEDEAAALLSQQKKAEEDNNKATVDEDSAEAEKKKAEQETSTHGDFAAVSSADDDNADGSKAEETVSNVKAPQAKKKGFLKRAFIKSKRTSLSKEKDMEEAEVSEVNNEIEDHIVLKYDSVAKAMEETVLSSQIMAKVGNEDKEADEPAVKETSDAKEEKVEQEAKTDVAASAAAANNVDLAEQSADETEAKEEDVLTSKAPQAKKKSFLKRAFSTKSKRASLVKKQQDVEDQDIGEEAPDPKVDKVGNDQDAVTAKEDQDDASLGIDLSVTATGIEMHTPSKRGLFHCAISPIANSTMSPSTDKVEGGVIDIVARTGSNNDGTASCSISDDSNNEIMKTFEKNATPQSSRLSSGLTKTSPAPTTNKKGETWNVGSFLFGGMTTDFSESDDSNDEVMKTAFENENATPPVSRLTSSGLPKTPPTPTKIGESWNVESCLFDTTEEGPPSPSASILGSTPAGCTPPRCDNVETNIIDEPLTFECRLQESTNSSGKESVNVSMEWLQTTGNPKRSSTAGAVPSNNQGSQRELLQAPPPVNRKLTFDTDNFSESFCKASFQSRAVEDVTTVYREEDNDVNINKSLSLFGNVVSEQVALDDQIELAQAKQHAFDIVKRSRSDASRSSKHQQKFSHRVGSSLKKNMLKRGGNNAAAEVHDATNNADITLATVDMTKEASMLMM